MNPPKDSVVRKINYDENPFLTTTMIDVIQADKDEDIELYNFDYLGIPLESNENTTIPRKWIEASVGFKLDKLGSKIVGFDPAVTGLRDSNGFICRYGNVITDIKEIKLNQVQATREVYAYANDNGVDEIVYDVIGIGQGSSTEFEHLLNGGYSININACNVGKPPPDRFFDDSDKKNKDLFKNLKAYLWWSLRIRFKRTYEVATGIKNHDLDKCISLPQMKITNKLIDELSSPLYLRDESNRIRIEKKEDMLKRGIKSGNLADALILSYSNDGNFNFMGLLE